MPQPSPVAYIVFNRPEHTEKSFGKLREQRPAELFVIADGPRVDHPTDEERCRRVREIVDEVDWPCTVHRDYADANLGCKERVSSGLDWVFSRTDRAIVLEDDCIPNGDFFTFCDDLLDRYKDDDRVLAVTGDNFQDGIHRGDGAYYFSKYNHVWGWATWSRAWHHFDKDIGFWPDWKQSSHWPELHPDPVERGYWEAILDRQHRGEIDTWDYSWTASVWQQGGLTATPNVNLVSNIGFGPDATHTQARTDVLERETEPLGQLVHPAGIRQDTEADRYTFDHPFGGATMRERARPLGSILWATKGVGRRLKRRLNRQTRR